MGQTLHVAPHLTSDMIYGETTPVLYDKRLLPQ